MDFRYKFGRGFLRLRSWSTFVIGVQFKSSNDPENLPEGWHLWRTSQHEWAITIKTQVICKSIDLFNTKIIKKGKNYQFQKSWCYLLHTLIDEGRKKTVYLSLKEIYVQQQPIFPALFGGKIENSIYLYECLEIKMTKFYFADE